MTSGSGAPLLILLGRPRLASGAGIEDAAGGHVFSPDKRHQLLAYLAYQRDWVERPRLAALWWPDVDDGTAMQNLRQLLRRARPLTEAFGAGDLEVEPQRARWGVATDVEVLRAQLTAADGEAVRRVYRGALMDGLEGYEDSEFARWLEVEREQLHAAAREALVSHVERERAAGRLAEAVATVERLLVLDPFDEDAMASRMALGLEANAPGAALGLFERFSRRLEREFALAPSVGTLALARRLEEAAARPVAVAEPPPTPVAAPSETPGTAALPTPGTTFVGRDLELSEIAARLTPEDGRLVTLVGPSGIGKTRLAIEAARELAAKYADGAAFVPLAAVRTVDDMARAVANALGLTINAQVEPVEDLASKLARRHQLVVLDNFEQLVVAGAAALAVLLSRSPGLDVIVTSHERLGLAQEWVVRVDGLARSQESAASDAVALFLDRARRVRSDFEAAPDELPSVAAICQAVHGSPLGIELAAVWTRVLSVAEIAAEIARAPDFLATRAPDVPERHRSLRAAFSHSWSLLSEAEREVFPRLAVFRDGFSREAAASVAGANLALLAALVDKALLRSGGGRFDVHPLLLTFLGEALAEAPGEPARTRERLARFVLGLVEHVAGRSPGPGQVAWLQRLDAERASIDDAFAWAQEVNDVDLGLRLAAPLLRFWLARGLLREGRAHVERVLASRTDARPSLALAAALNTAGGLALGLADYQAAEEYYAASREVARAIAHEPALARVAIGAGLAAARRGDTAAARAHYLEGLELHRRHGNLEAATGILNNLGVLALDLGDPEEAVKWLTDAVTSASELGDPYYEGSSLNNLGWAAWLRGDIGEARERLEQGLARCRAAGDRQGSATALNNLALARLRCGDSFGATAAAHEALELRATAGDRWGLAYSWDVHAVLAAERGDDRAAVQLWSAAEALRSLIGSPLQPGWLQWQAGLRDAVRERLGEAAHAAAAAAGATLDVEAATSLARGAP